jgi:hypothetical protein
LMNILIFEVEDQQGKMLATMLYRYERYRVSILTSLARV